MAQCRAEGRKHPSAMDMYVGALHSKLHSPRKMDVDWSRYGDAQLQFPSSSSSSSSSAAAAAAFHRQAENSWKEPTCDSSTPSQRSTSFREDASGADPKQESCFASGSCNVARMRVSSAELHGIAKAIISPKVTTDMKPSATGKVSGLTSRCDEKDDYYSRDSSSSQSLSAHGDGKVSHSTSLSNVSADPENKNAMKMASCNGPEYDQAEHSTRIHKSAEQNCCRSHSGASDNNNNNNNTATRRLYKSGEQAAAKSNKTDLKEGSHGGGLLTVGSLKQGAGYVTADPSSSESPQATRRWSSADSPLGLQGRPSAARDGARRSSVSHGGSSDGGSPMAKDLWRRSSTGGYGFPDSSSFTSGGGGSPSSGKDGAGSRSSVLNTGTSCYRDASSSSSSSSSSVRGMGNILSSNVAANNKSNKVSAATTNYSKTAGAMNENKMESSGMKKADDASNSPTASASASPATSHHHHHPIHSSLGNICSGKRNPTGNILSHGTVLRSSSNKASDDPRNGCPINDPEEIKNAGNEQYKKQNYAEAVALYDKSIALSPNHAPYRSNRAAALIGLGRLAEAVQECEEAIRLDPHYTRAHQRAANLYLRLGLIESAKRHLAAIPQVEAKDMQSLQMVQRHISRCIEARKLCNWRNVLAESNAAITAGADSAPQVLGYKSEALLKSHKSDEAHDVCAQAQKLEASLHKLGVAPADAFLHMLRAHIDMYLGRFDDAIKAAESAAKLDPRNSEAVALLKKARAVGQTRMLGNELFNAGKFFEACAAYGEGLESDPTNAVLLCNRAACRSKIGQWEKAIEDCDAALNAQPNYIKALMRRANCNAKLERWEESLRDYEVLRREMPNDMEVARGYFDVQVAMKKSRGEEIHKMRFGGDVEEVFGRDEFREIIDSPGLSVVEFFTRQNDRCREISPFIDQLCKRYPCVHFVKVDVDENPVIAKAESLSFVPTFKIYKNGQKLKEILGPSQQALEYAVRHYSL